MLRTLRAGYSTITSRLPASTFGAYDGRTTTFPTGCRHTVAQPRSVYDSCTVTRLSGVCIAGSEPVMNTRGVASFKFRPRQMYGCSADMEITITPSGAIFGFNDRSRITATPCWQSFCYIGHCKSVRLPQNTQVPCLYKGRSASVIRNALSSSI